MPRHFIQSILSRGFDAIGQIRIDTRLYDEPPKKKTRLRGRPRKYGDKYTKKRIAHLKKSEVTLKLWETAITSLSEYDSESPFFRRAFSTGCLVRI